LFIVFNDCKIGKVTFSTIFQFSSTRGTEHGVETCLIRLKGFCIMLVTTFTPCFTGMDVMYEVAADESSDFEALIGSDF